MIYASTNGRDYVTDADGRLTGADAVKFFSLSQLPRGELKQVYCSYEPYATHSEECLDRSISCIPDCLFLVLKNSLNCRCGQLLM